MFLLTLPYFNIQRIQGNMYEQRSFLKKKKRYMFFRVMCNVIILPFIHVITNDKKQQKIEKNQIMHEWVYFIKMCSYVQWKRFFFSSSMRNCWVEVLKFVLVKGYILYDNINIGNTKLFITFSSSTILLVSQVNCIFSWNRKKQFGSVAAINGVVTRTALRNVHSRMI